MYTEYLLNGIGAGVKSIIEMEEVEENKMSYTFLQLSQ